MENETCSKNFEINFQILMAEIRAYREKLWERSRFCNCGAESLAACECPSEKKKRYMNRADSKVNEKFKERLNASLAGRVPQSR